MLNIANVSQNTGAIQLESSCSHPMGEGGDRLVDSHMLSVTFVNLRSLSATSRLLS